MDEEVKILVVDDDAVTRLIMRRFLNCHGYYTDEAADASEALSLLAQGNYTLLISDWRMPGMDGLGLCRRIRKDFPKVPVIIMSGTALKEEEALQAGAVDCLRKPFDGETLCLMIARALSERSTTGREIPGD
ncbi:MAG: response regulator [Anaerolineae bacterium]